MVVDHMLLPFNVCLFLILFQALRSSKINKIFLNAKFNKINIRLYNTGPVIALKQLKAAFISKSLFASIHVFYILLVRI